MGAAFELSLPGMHMFMLGSHCWSEGHDAAGGAAVGLAVVDVVALGLEGG